jgi:hypothetical protein
MWRTTQQLNATTFNNQATTPLNVNNIATTTYYLGDRGGDHSCTSYIALQLKKI